MTMRWTFVLLTLCAMTACTTDDDTSDELDAAPPADAPVDAAPPMPDASPPPPLKDYGEACSSKPECASGLCVVDVCSRACTVEVPNDCQDVDAFCVPLQAGGFACYGEIETGNDDDDAILRPGDSTTRSLIPLGDADLFYVALDPGSYTITVTPKNAFDLQLEAYSDIGEPTGVFNTGKAGEAEAALWEPTSAITGFFVVRQVGPTSGSYTISLVRK
jgi:hypothetical protein